ncbi:MAG TPA: D-alanyl-D-alanine carboxypeptidase/D-alanyl-D-alanine-endopeptidase [Chitinophagaceae bacterium]|nr:D-alanyl-D-alanine carboxypeptidase/D-alanyl-D-alanine-endopeptidase [Chitinophagaceae bacterium]
MKKVFLLIAGCLLFISGIVAQTVSQRLQKAFQQFETDSQLRHAISSLYVIDAKTGQVVFDKNSQVGLAPASTQKIITSVTAFELLGRGYVIPMYVRYSGYTQRDTLFGDIILDVWGDPTFGSNRYYNKKEFILSFILSSIELLKVKVLNGNIIINDSRIDNLSIPDGWIWQDIGNYYGAPSKGLNWMENQFDILLSSGNILGDTTKIIKFIPDMKFERVVNEVVTAPKGSGDNAYVYLLPGSNTLLVRGTIPVNEVSFKISASLLNPNLLFSSMLKDKISASNIKLLGSILDSKHCKDNNIKIPDVWDDLGVTSSPSLDSIIYWFNRKSINLYGEALIKTFAYEKQGFGSTDSGVVIVKKFWKDKGLDEDELNIYDGSGLSPLNRVTTHAQVEILKYAKTKDWFPYFFRSLPDYNGMTKKSGTISDVKGFCGYHKTKEGKEYIFSFLVNNYNGKTSGVVSKMYKVLDVLK